MQKATFETKRALAEMLRGGVIMDVVNVEQARIAEEVGASAVMALERVPAQIRKEGGVARASSHGSVSTATLLIQARPFGARAPRIAACALTARPAAGPAAGPGTVKEIWKCPPAGITARGFGGPRSPGPSSTGR